MYTYCAFETAWEKNKVSPWCSIFNKSDLMVIHFKYIIIIKYYLNTYKMIILIVTTHQVKTSIS
jgi:hypothetical protein